MAKYREDLETGDRVFFDQTEALRIHYWQKKHPGRSPNPYTPGQKQPGPQMQTRATRRPWRELNQRAKQNILASIQDKARIQAIRSGATKNAASQIAKAAASAFLQRQAPKSNKPQTRRTNNATEPSRSNRGDSQRVMLDAKPQLKTPAPVSPKQPRVIPPPAKPVTPNLERTADLEWHSDVVAEARKKLGL